MWIVCVLVCLECMKLKTSSAITRHKQTLIHPETSTRHLTPFSWFLFALPSALHSPGLVVAAGSAIESIVNPKEVGLGHCRLVLVRQCPWKKQCWKWCHPNLRILIYIVLTSFSEQCFTFSFFVSLIQLDPYSIIPLQYQRTTLKDELPRRPSFPLGLPGRHRRNGIPPRHCSFWTLDGV